jgi:undecaprenyl-diphosphatase
MVMVAAVLLGIVQGITEFFPISSTAHLVLFPWFFGWTGTLNSLAFDVALHGGTLVSLLICFRRDLVAMLREDRRLLLFIAAGTVPAGVAGLLFEEQVGGLLRVPVVIAVALVVVGVVMYVSERFGKGRPLAGITLRDALFVGAAQAMALVPGVSRSGITISAGLMRGVGREDAARFSFLLSIPVVAGAAVLEGKELFTSPQAYDLRLVGVGFLVSTLVGIAAIEFLLRYLKSHTLNLFVLYRVLLAAVIGGWIWLGG